LVLFGDLHGDVLHHHDVEGAVREREREGTPLGKLHLVV
jgi:hypothetical protein